MKSLINYSLIIRKYEIIIASMVVFIITLVLSYFILIPNFTTAKNISDQQSLLQKRFSSLHEKDKTLRGLDNQYYKENLSKLNQILPGSKDFVSLLSRFDVLQSKAQVLIVKTDFRLGVISTSSAGLVKAPGTNAYMIPVSFEVSGNVSSLNKFIETLTDLTGRLITTDEIKVNYKEDNTIQANFKGKAYMYPLPMLIGALDSPLPKLDNKAGDLLKRVAGIPLVEIAETEKKIETLSVGKKDLFD